MEHALTDLLTAGSSDLGLELSAPQCDQLANYLHLLSKWNAKLNLVGPGTEADWAVRHVLDSLAPQPWVATRASVLDLGSGAGLPGVPLAVSAPSAQFVLLEPRANRVAFLQSVVAALRLANVKVRRGRAEDEKEKFALALGRAVAPPEDYAVLAAGCLEASGRFVLFHQREPPAELGSSKRIDQRTYRIQGSQPRTVGLYQVFHVEHS